FTDFGEGTLTSSGYPNIVKEWKRGTPMTAAKTVYEGKPGDMYISAGHDHTPGYERDFVSRTIAFYNDEIYLRNKDGSLAKVDAPNSAQKNVHKDWLVLELREPYQAGGKAYTAGSLIATNFDDFMAGKREFTALFEPTDKSSLAGYTWTRDHLVLNVMEAVKNRLFVLTPGKGEWAKCDFVGAPPIGTIGAGAVYSDQCNAVWLSATVLLTPTTLATTQIRTPREALT